MKSDILLPIPGKVERVSRPVWQCPGQTRNGPGDPFYMGRLSALVSVGGEGFSAAEKQIGAWSCAGSSDEDGGMLDWELVP